MGCDIPVAERIREPAQGTVGTAPHFCDQLFTRLDPSQWKSARTTNAIERLNEEFRRRIRAKTVLPGAETLPMLLWALLASGQIQMGKVDGWETLSRPPLTFPPEEASLRMPGARRHGTSTAFATRPPGRACGR